MEVTKRRVPLAAIEPSATNPRRDFGDIAALADTIRATGGEPVNPPVVVADGNVFRIVDGERRYRALREVHRREPGRQVTVLVAGDMDAANELVAMLATDDKQPLTDAERAAGVQQMLLLGVDTERAARASRAPLGKVAAMRAVAGMAPEGVQVTLDQALAASELPEEYAGRVLAAGDWEAEAARARREIAAREAERALLAALEGAGWEVLGDDGEAEAGHRYVGRVSADSAASDIERLSAEGARRAYLSGATCYAYAPAGAGDDPELEALRRAFDEDAAACAEMAGSMAAFIASGALERAVPPELDEAAREHRERAAPWWADDVLDGLGDLGGYMRSLPVGAYDRALAALDLVRAFRSGTRESYGSMGPVPSKLRALQDAYDLLELCGWAPSEADRAKYAEAAGAPGGGDD